jgi:multidrug efflux pump subunit AcrB
MLSSVPVLQLSLGSDRLNEQQLYDYGLYNLRQQLAPVPGVTFPDSRRRQIQTDYGGYRSAQISGRRPDPSDVVNAVNARNLTLPSGLAKIGDTQYTVRTNAMPNTIADLKVPADRPRSRAARGASIEGVLREGVIAKSC